MPKGVKVGAAKHAYLDVRRRGARGGNTARLRAAHEGRKSRTCLQPRSRRKSEPSVLVTDATTASPSAFEITRWCRRRSHCAGLDAAEVPASGRPIPNGSATRVAIARAADRDVRADMGFSLITLGSDQICATPTLGRQYDATGSLRERTIERPPGVGATTHRLLAIGRPATAEVSDARDPSRLEARHQPTVPR